MSMMPCRNPNCPSYGHPHPNCRCYAMGGTVCRSGAPHEPECEFFAEGGMAEPKEHPAVTLGHSAVHHGMLGIFKDVGRKGLSDPDKHYDILDKARSQVLQGEHKMAAETIKGAPVSGVSSQNKSEMIMKHLGSELAQKEVNPNGFKAASEYLHSAMNGEDTLKSHSKTLFDKQKSSDEVKANHDHRGELDKYLKGVQENPQQLLDVGGPLGHYLPGHAAEMGAFSARATDYLNAIRPKSVQINPLDVPIEPDAIAMDSFHKQLDIAQNPLLIMQKVRHGELLPSEIKTAQIIYPALYEKMQQQASESLINAKAEGKEIPYQQAVSLGLLLGQPLESSMTTFGMQAIMNANAGAQAQQESQTSSKGKSSSRPTAAQIKQIDKVDNLYATPIESREINKKS